MIYRKIKLICCFVLLFIISFTIGFNFFNNKQQKIETQDQTPVVEVLEINTTTQVETTTTTTKKKEEKKTTQPKQKVTTQETNTTAKETFTGYITHYGPDCKGCGGTTAAGYNVKNTIYYNDSQYGQVRIVAMDRAYPLYSIIQISNYKQGAITAIVLDRGGAIKGNKIDLLVSSESEASKLGIQKNAEVKVLRYGK